jgi:hypothetical protein
MLQTKVMAKVALSVAALAVPLAACGDDDEQAVETTVPAETLADFGARLQTDCPGGDPGFDRFLAEHPEPTVEQWAAFLPSPLGMLSSFAACIDASNPPAPLTDEIESAVTAMGVVVGDLEKALAAAKAGDLEAVDATLTEMNAGHTEAMGAAEKKVGDAIGAG